MRSLVASMGTVSAQDAHRAVVQSVQQASGQGGRLWTPAQGASGLIVVARPALSLVVGGRILEIGQGELSGGRLRQVNLGGLVIVSNTRQKEPTRVIGHPDLASGASVQRGDALYVSVAEAIYRETRGEEVEIHLAPTPEDAEALSDLRVRARNRWENDRLPDGWTRPLPPMPKPGKDQSIEGGEMPDELRVLADRIRAKEQDTGH